MLQSASLISRAELPLAIAINGQQFLSAPAPFRYYGPADWPHIDYDDVAPSFRYPGLSPTSGPVEVSPSPSPSPNPNPNPNPNLTLTLTLTRCGGRLF